MTGTAFVVARTTGNAAAAAMADSLAGATVIIGVPMVLMVAVHWRSLTDSQPTPPQPNSA